MDLSDLPLNTRIPYEDNICSLVSTNAGIFTSGVD